MRVLITGGAGFVGSNLARYINQISPETRLYVLDDLSTGKLSNLDDVDVEFFEGPVANFELLTSLAARVDSIVHLGALGSVPRSIKDPVSSHVANLTGTLNVLEAARQHNVHVIFSSSSSVYGANEKLPKSEFDWTRPMSPYAATKLGAEAYVLAYRNSYGLPAMVFRFFNVYGPYQSADHAYAAVVPRFVDAAMKNLPLQIHGDGLQSRDFTHVDTVCAALWGAVRQRLSLSDPVNLAFGTSTSILALIDILETALGDTVEHQFVDPRVGDVKASRADGIRLKELFPDLRPVSLAEGVASTVKWFRDNA